MKKLNNRGFAVTTVLYGIIIMVFLSVFSLMAILATNRTNTHNLADIIEDELIRFGKTSASFDSGVASAQEFIVPEGQSGWYKIELWGASGADAVTKSGFGSMSISGGKGAYTSGLVYLQEKQKLYFYVGGKPTGNSGGFNGGGNAVAPDNYNFGGGGGATDVRFNGTAYSDRIMVAAGGGGANAYINGSVGGDGGTIQGLPGTKSDNTGVTGDATSKYTPATGGRQASGGLGGKGYYRDGSSGGVGIGGSYSGTGGLYGSAGGAGYYGGGEAGYSLYRVGSGAGGSSYISGYAGVCSGVSPNQCKSTLHSSGKYFVNGVMIPGINVGSGKASIKLISSGELTKINSKLNNVKHIRDCINGSSADEANHWLEVQAISSGQNLVFNKVISPTVVTDGINLIKNGYISEGAGESGETNSLGQEYYDAGTGQQCIDIDLGANYDLDEIAIWHYFTDKDSRSYKGNGLSVSADGYTYTYITSNNNMHLISESANGIRYSAYQPDSLVELPEGEYYIKLASSTNKFLTGDGLARFDLFSGDSKQKWTVRKEGTGYSLTEGSSSYILRKDSDSAFANSQYTTGMTNYVWNITPAGNGTYYLQQNSNYLDFDGKFKSTVPTDTNVLKQQFIFIKI